MLAQVYHSLVGIAVTAAAVGSLALMARLWWAARQFVASCRARQETERKLVEMLKQYLEQPANAEAMWSASAAMAVC